MSLFNSLIPAFNRVLPAERRDGSGDVGPTVRPAYDVKETDDAFGLTVYLPGVSRDGLELTAEDTTLSIVGRRAWKRPDGWNSLHRETSEANYQLVLTHENDIDLDKIDAELRDGVLRVSLPKPETAKPRKIAVN